MIFNLLDWSLLKAQKSFTVRLEIERIKKRVMNSYFIPPQNRYPLDLWAILNLILTLYIGQVFKKVVLFGKKVKLSLQVAPFQGNLVFEEPVFHLVIVKALDLWILWLVTQLYFIHGQNMFLSLCEVRKLIERPLSGVDALNKTFLHQVKYIITSVFALLLSYELIYILHLQFLAMKTMLI